MLSDIGRQEFTGLGMDKDKSSPSWLGLFFTRNCRKYDYSVIIELQRRDVDSLIILFNNIWSALSFNHIQMRALYGICCLFISVSG